MYWLKFNVTGNGIDNIISKIDRPKICQYKNKII